MFLLPVCWLILSLLAGLHERTGKLFSLICLIATAAASLVIFYMTVIGRKAGTHEVYLIPFYSLWEAKQHPEFYRQLTMNVFLFEPLGCAAPFAAEYLLRYGRGKVAAISTGARQAAKYGFLFCFGFSILIEACQGIFGRGRAETDDVIMNLLGALIGIGCYALYGICFKKRAEHRVSDML